MAIESLKSRIAKIFRNDEWHKNLNFSPYKTTKTPRIRDYLKNRYIKKLKKERIIFFFSIVTLFFVFVIFLVNSVWGEYFLSAIVLIGLICGIFVGARNFYYSIVNTKWPSVAGKILYTDGKY